MIELESLTLKLSTINQNIVQYEMLIFIFEYIIHNICLNNCIKIFCFFGINQIKLLVGQK